MVSISKLYTTETNRVGFLLGHSLQAAGQNTYLAYHFRYSVGKEKSHPLCNLLNDIGSFTLSLGYHFPHLTHTHIHTHARARLVPKLTNYLGILWGALQTLNQNLWDGIRESILSSLPNDSAADLN